MIQGALFDMDGVLVDNRDAHFRAFELFCRRYGVTDWQQRLQGAFGMGNRDILARLLPPQVIEEIGVEALSEEKEAIYRKLYASDIVPVSGLEELLGRLQKGKIRCAVGSSGCRANVDFVLGSLGIDSYFEARISGDRVSRCKPDPEIYLEAAASLGIAPAQCIVFEDAPAGIESALHAGVKRIVALATTLSREELRESGASFIVDDFTQVTDLMLR